MRTMGTMWKKNLKYVGIAYFEGINVTAKREFVRSFTQSFVGAFFLASILLFNNCAFSAERELPQKKDISILIPIKVKEGTSLIKIARKFCKLEGAWHELARYNKIDEPYTIRAGSVIYVPQELLITQQVTARVASVIGGVFYLQKDGTLTQVKRGEQVVPGKTLITENDGFAHLVFPDNSYIRISSNSKFSLTYLIRLVDESLKAEFFLERGNISLEVRKKLRENETFNTRTPVSITGVRGTHYRVKMHGDTSRIETLQGKVEVSASGKEIIVAAGYGSVINKDAPPSAAEALLAPPVVDVARVYKTRPFSITAPKREGMICMRVTTDPEGNNTVWGGEFESGRSFTIHGLEDGKYYAFFTTISKNGLEGKPTGAKGFTLRTTPVAPLLSKKYDGQVFYGDSVQCRWLEVEGVKRYKIQVAEDLGFTKIIRNEEVNGSELTLKGLAPNSYFYRVMSIADDDFLSTSSAVDSFATRKMPKMSGAQTAAKGDALTLQWLEVDGESRYALQFSRDKSFFEVIKSVSGLEEPFYTLTKLFQPGTYYVRMRVESNEGDSPWTPPQKLTIEPPPFSFLNMGILSIFIGLVLL